MAFLNFKEIESSRGSNNTFEYFARDFLKLLGFVIVDGPYDGPDGGRDLIIEEIRQGRLGQTKISWLVSCKHYVHTGPSGKSVSAPHESNLENRLNLYNCSSFIGFYSTSVTESLAKTVRTISQQKKGEFHFYTPEDIETELIRTEEGARIASKYFPVSFNKWNTEQFSPRAKQVLSTVLTELDTLKIDIEEIFKGMNLDLEKSTKEQLKNIIYIELYNLVKLSSLYKTILYYTESSESEKFKSLIAIEKDIDTAFNSTSSKDANVSKLRKLCDLIPSLYSNIEGLDIESSGGDGE
ncbi:restriction endonuclease [Bacillus sp. RAR_GA_16]|uniref:restriction endonuclease n=1 Tax=Bacillus sp. RAR_GA_16 TaxID=2876774 RepID=UPI001CD032FF|nr:restriction endonuclease [Bacillus sp. RAR_GA_16]MCA0174569.1 restriction endonuclease [Bacillus sp. RAR_GA_16]